MPDTVALTIALALVVAGVSIITVALVSVIALRRPAVDRAITARDRGQVHIMQAGGNVHQARLPDTQIAALEDALSFLVQARDSLEASNIEDADLAVRLAAFILSLQRQQKYRPNLSMTQLRSLFQQHQEEAPNGRS